MTKKTAPCKSKFQAERMRVNRMSNRRKLREHDGGKLTCDRQEWTHEKRTAITPEDLCSSAIVSAEPCHWPACKMTVNGQTYCDEGRNCNG
jgi:hypothetical protein